MPPSVPCPSSNRPRPRPQKLDVRIRTREHSCMCIMYHDCIKTLKRLEFPAWTQWTLTITRTITTILLLRMFIHFITPGTFSPSYAPHPRTISPIPRTSFPPRPLSLVIPCSGMAPSTPRIPRTVSLLCCAVASSPRRCTGEQQTSSTSTSAAKDRLVAGGHRHDTTQDRRTRLEAATSRAACAASPPTRAFLFLHLLGIRRTSTLPSSSF